MRPESGWFKRAGRRFLRGEKGKIKSESAQSNSLVYNSQSDPLSKITSCPPLECFWPPSIRLISVYLWQRCLRRRAGEKHIKVLDSMGTGGMSKTDPRSLVQLWAGTPPRPLQYLYINLNLTAASMLQFCVCRETETATVLNMRISVIVQASLWSRVIKSRPLEQKRLINLSANKDITCSQEVGSSLPRFWETIKRVIKVSFPSFITKECGGFKTQHS